MPREIRPMVIEEMERICSAYKCELVQQADSQSQFFVLHRWKTLASVYMYGEQLSGKPYTYQWAVCDRALDHNRNWTLYTGAPGKVSGYVEVWNLEEFSKLFAALHDAIEQNLTPTEALASMKEA